MVCFTVKELLLSSSGFGSTGVSFFSIAGLLDFDIVGLDLEQIGSTGVAFFSGVAGLLDFDILGLFFCWPVPLALWWARTAVSVISLPYPIGAT